MSHQTGIKANEKLKKFFTSYLDLNVRVFKVSIIDEELALTSFNEAKGSWSEDFDRLVVPLVEPEQPAYILYRLDTKNETTGYDWLLISWSPDESPVRQKMLFASTKATLKQEFGSGQIKEEYHATAIDDISLKGLERHRLSIKSPAPLTSREEEMVELRKSEVSGLTEISVDSRSQTLSGVAFPLLPEALTAVQRLSQKQVNYVQLKIDDNLEYSPFLSNSCPSFNTTIETDPNSKNLEIKITVPIYKNTKSSISFSYLCKSPEKLHLSQTSSDSFSFVDQQVICFNEEDKIKSISISPVIPPSISSIEASSDPFSFVDQQVFSIDQQDKTKLDTISPPIPSLSSVSSIESSFFNLDGNLDPESITDNTDSIISQQSSFYKNSSLSSSPSDVKQCLTFSNEVKSKAPKRKLNVPVENFQTAKKSKNTKAELSKKKPVDNTTKSKDSVKNLQSIIDNEFLKVKSIYEQCTNELNPANIKVITASLESALDVFVLKSESLNISSDVMTQMCDLLVTFVDVDTTFSLIDEEGNQDSSKIYPTIILSAVAVFILLNIYKKNPVYDESVISKITAFLYNQFFKSLSPVLYFSNNSHSMKNNFLSESNIDKLYGKNSFKNLLNKFEEIIFQFSNCPEIVTISNNAFSKLMTVCVSSFFIPDCPNLQYACLKLVTKYFALYEDKREIILDAIISCLALLNFENNVILKTFQLKSSGIKVQFLTAALLHFVDSAIYINEIKSIDEMKSIFTATYKAASKLFSNFYNKLIYNSASCNNFKSVMENLISDLLLISNEAKWPTTNFVFRLFNKLINFYLFSKKQDKSLVSVCLDYLILILPSFRKNFLMKASVLNCLSGMVNSKTTENFKSNENYVVDFINCDIIKSLKLILETLLNNKNFKAQAHLIQFYCYVLIEEVSLKKEKFKGNSSQIKIVDKTCNEIFVFIYEIIQNFNGIVPVNETLKALTLNDKKEKLMKSICLYLGAVNPFATNSDKFLKLIVLNMRSSNLQVQLKAIKFLTNVIKVDQSLLFYHYVEVAIKTFVLNSSSAIRERIISLLGHHIFLNESIVNKYLDIISDRLLDVSVGVRKAVVNILCKFCSVYPQHAEISDIISKLLRRLNDEPQIIKIIVYFFKKKWIDGLLKHEGSTEDMIKEMLCVLKIAKDNGAVNLFERLVLILVNNSNADLKNECFSAYNIIGKGLVKFLLENQPNSEVFSSENCYILLSMIGYAKPDILSKLTPKLFPHFCTLLESEKSSPDLKYIIPLTELMLKSKPIYFQKEEKVQVLIKKLVSLVGSAPYQIMMRSAACLALVTKINQDFSVVVSTFLFYHKLLKKYVTDSFHLNELTLSRVVIVLGLFIKYFNFSKIQPDGFDVSLVKETVELIVTLLINDAKNRKSILQSFTSICYRFSDTILKKEVILLFCNILKESCHSVALKIQVLTAIKVYLEDDNLKSKLLNQNWNALSKTESLKKMNDVSAGKPCVVVQHFLSTILECYFVNNQELRLAVVKLLATILQFNLIQPDTIMQYLICMVSDHEPLISSSAATFITELEMKNLNPIKRHCLKGISLSFKLMKILSSDSDILRGYVIVKGSPLSILAKLYELCSKISGKHFVLTSILNYFDESNEHNFNLKMLLFLADNLAYFPYKEVHEVLFVLHQTSSILCNNAVELFEKIKVLLSEKHKKNRVTLVLDENNNEANQPETNGEEKSNKEIFDCSARRETYYCQNAYAYILLLKLWQFLKSYYNISDKNCSSFSLGNTSSFKKALVKNSAIKGFYPQCIIAYLQCDVSTLSSNDVKKLLRNLLSEFEDSFQVKTHST